MLWRSALFALLAWLLSVLGVHTVGKMLHVLLLAGVMMLPLAFGRAREAALTATIDRPPDKK